MASLSRWAAFSAMIASINGVVLGSGAGWVEATGDCKLVSTTQSLRDTDSGARAFLRQMVSGCCSLETWRTRGNPRLCCARVNSIAQGTRALKHTFFDSCDPTVRLALLSRDLLIWGKLHNCLSLGPYVQSQHLERDGVRECHTPALSLKVCPSKDRLNRASCSSVLNPIYAREVIFSLFNLGPRRSEIPTRETVPSESGNGPFLDLSGVK